MSLYVVASTISAALTNGKIAIATSQGYLTELLRRYSSGMKADTTQTTLTQRKARCLGNQKRITRPITPGRFTCGPQIHLRRSQNSRQIYVRYWWQVEFMSTNDTFLAIFLASKTGARMTAW